MDAQVVQVLAEAQAADVQVLADAQAVLEVLAAAQAVVQVEADVVNNTNYLEL